MKCFSFFLLFSWIAGAPFLQSFPSTKIQGILLVSSDQEFETIDQQKLEGIHFVGMQNRKELSQDLQRFLGVDIDAEVLKDIKAQVFSTYKELKQSFITIKIPEQEISSGVIALVISEPVVGKVSYQGSRWFSSSFLSRKIPLRSGQKVEEGRLLDDVAWMNRNPFHHSELIFAPGQSVGLTDVEVYTKDRFPLSVYAGFDNTGTDVTGNHRLYAGFNWGNAFGINDLLSYQFTTADDFHKFTSNYLNYTSFLPWKHILVVYGAYSTIHPKVVSFRHEGKYGQGSFRYEVPIRPIYTPFLQQFNLGADYKFLNSNLFFVDQADQAPIITQSVNVFQLVGSYQLEDHFSSQELILKLEMVVSPFYGLFHRFDSDYEALRPHAKVIYAYGRAVFGYTVGSSSTFSLSTMTQGQASTGPLLSSEQFGLGGYSTVRGYDERIYLADNAVCCNLELRAPSIRISKKFENELIFLVFNDFGWGGNYQQSSGLVSNAYLWSVGPGIRWNFAPYLMTRLDYGFRLHSIQFQRSGLGKVHFSISARY